MKYFEKKSALGVPKSNIERIMTHYKVSEKEAKKTMKEKPIKELLPSRGSNVFNKGRPVFIKKAYMDQAAVIAMGSNWGRVLAKKHIKAKDQPTKLKQKSTALKYTKGGVAAGVVAGLGAGALLEKASPSIKIPTQSKGIYSFFKKLPSSKELAEMAAHAKKLKVKNYFKKSTILAGTGGIAGMAIGANIDILRKKYKK